MLNDIKKYPNLFTANEMEALCACGAWKLCWKQGVADDPDFDVLQWWERGCNHTGLANLGRVALNALIFPVTTTGAEGSFRIKIGLLTTDQRFMSHDSRIGYLLAMINGNVNKHIPSWALQPQTIFLEISWQLL